jgi:hypothetical protein
LEIEGIYTYLSEFMVGAMTLPGDSMNRVIAFVGPYLEDVTPRKPRVMSIHPAVQIGLATLRSPQIE